ncbi:MAG: sigma-70 family RNA polymerase sigma factor [Clostridia bacterium]
MSECLTKLGEHTLGGREHYGLAVFCAKRFYGRGVPREELIGEAEAALLWAATRFDQSRGTRFSSYAIPFVLGALRELCRRAAPMYVPRSELRVLCAAEDARMALYHREGREPTVEELGTAVGVEPVKLGAMLSAQERMKRAEGEADLNQCPAEQEDFEDWLMLKDVISRLEKPYAQVLWLRFGVGFSQEEVAKRFRVTQPQLSKWERQGKEKLRACLAEVG